MVRKVGNIAVKGIRFTDNRVYFKLADGREIGAPLEWFPRLKEASPSERENYYLTANGTGIHWEELDEDISIRYLLKEEFLLLEPSLEKNK
ncbi:DUF2442 domain-containing protein [Thermovibrio sp.]